MKILIIVATCAIAIAVWSCSKKPASSTPAQQNSRKQINEQAFANMRVKTKWKLEADMLWGFFFTNSTKEPLAPVAKMLEGKGYRVVDIYLDDAKENWWLHVERIETHTADSLTRREEELSDIATKANLGSYDGWDVGPVAK